MKKVKLINCMGAKEDNTDKAVYLYETPQELLEVLPNATSPRLLDIKVKDTGFAGFVINDTKAGRWIQVYKREVEIIQDDMRKEGVDYEWMLVGDKEETCCDKRMVIAVLPEGVKDRYIAVTEATKAKFIEGYEYSICTWKFAKPIPKPIFTNSIGQEWFDENDESLVYWFNKITLKICWKKFSDVEEPFRKGDEVSTEIFKTKEDVKNWVLKQID